VELAAKVVVHAGAVVHGVVPPAKAAVHAVGPGAKAAVHAVGPEAPAEAAPPFQPAPKITGFRDHALQQIQSRDGGVGVNDNALQDAFEHPVKSPQYVPDQYGGTYKYVGKTRQCA